MLKSRPVETVTNPHQSGATNVRLSSTIYNDHDRPHHISVIDPDNFVQHPMSAQGYNRYSYAHNNPLKYTDPSGESPLLIATAFMAVSGYIKNQVRSGEQFNVGHFAQFVAVNAAFMLVTSGVGGALSGIKSTAARMGIGALAHGAIGALYSFVNGGKASSGFLAGALSGAIPDFDPGAKGMAGNGGAILFASTMSGGLGSVIGGGEFYEGARQGFIVA